MSLFNGKKEKRISYLEGFGAGLERGKEMGYEAGRKKQSWTSVKFGTGPFRKPSRHEKKVFRV